MRKRTRYVFASLLVLAIVLLIPSVTYSKYISKIEFNMTFSSDKTERFYFDASATFAYEDLGTGSVLLTGDEVELSFDVMNFRGINVSNVNIDYKIELRENEKFTIEPETKTGNLQNSGSSVTNHETVTLKKKPGVVCDPLESITFVVTSTYPQERKIEIPTRVYTQQYEEYALTYEIYIGGEKVIASDDETTKDLEINGVSLNSIFGNDRLKSITNYSFHYTVTIPGSYTAKIKLNDSEDYVDVRNDGWDLGVDPVYEWVNERAQANLAKGPSSLVLDYTGYFNNVTQKSKIAVYLTEKFTKENSKVPVFDASYWLKNSKGASNRGSTGTYNGDSAKDIDTGDKWDWQNSKYKNGPVDMTKDEETGTYYFEWVFQTNNGNFLLDSFEVNGTGISIPFAPYIIRDNDGTVHYYKDAEYKLTTVLSNGTIVTVEFLKLFNNETQRVYRITFTNVLADVTITNGNLMQYATGAPEIVVYKLVGVEGNEIEIEGLTKALSSITIDASKVFEKISFKLQNYYEIPTIVLKDTSGNDLSATYTMTIDEDGRYVLSEFDARAIKNIGLLYIIATPMQFAIKYDAGGVSAELHGQEDWYDDNKGLYYTVENSRVIILNDYAPVDSSGAMSFRCWEFGFKNIRVGEIFMFEDLCEHAVKNEETGIYEITLTAIWDYR